MRQSELARLRQLAPQGVLPVGRIDDAPALAMRGFHSRDYWTSCDPSALFVARPQAGLGVVVDSGWRERWQNELSETERRTVHHFSCSMDLARELSPDFPRYGENIHAFSRRIHETGAMGIITSAWYPVPPEALLPGIMFTGQFTWNPDVTE